MGRKIACAPLNVYDLWYRTHFRGGTDVRTNIVIDERLIRQAMRATGLKTKRAAVEAGLKLLVQVKAQAGIRRLRGKVVWDGDLDDMRASRVPAAS